MKKICIYMLLLVSKSLFGQNLVNNWSFEDTVACPMGATQISKATGWDSYKLTPDYFNYCNTTQVGVPSNFNGYQYARTGNAYAGFVSFAYYGTNYREIFGSKLIQQLNMII